jgi:hypothetical protein
VRRSPWKHTAGVDARRSYAITRRLSSEEEGQKPAVRDCRLLFESQATSETWQVSCRLATPAEVATLPVLPAAFGD